MARDPAFLFYDGDAARDVSHMNRLERGCYFDLIQAQVKFGGYSVEQIRKILGKDFEECWPAIELVLRKDGDRYFIEWVSDSKEKRANHSEKQRKRIQNYWDNKKKEQFHGDTTVLPLENEIVNENENEVVFVYESWTEQILKKEDQNFETLLFVERWPIINTDAFEYWVKDHLDLLHRYPKMRPTNQQSFRRSVIKHLRENKDKQINGRNGFDQDELERRKQEAKTL